MIQRKVIKIKGIGGLKLKMNFLRTAEIKKKYNYLQVAALQIQRRVAQQVRSHRGGEQEQQEQEGLHVRLLQRGLIARRHAHVGHLPQPNVRQKYSLNNSQLVCQRLLNTCVMYTIE